MRMRPKLRVLYEDVRDRIALRAQRAAYDFETALAELLLRAQTRNGRRAKRGR